MKKLSFLICILIATMTFTGTTFSPLADEANEWSEPENSKVRLVIESYEVVSGEMLPGNVIEVKLVIRNTNEFNVAQNVVLSIVNNQGIAIPVDGKSNQTFLGSILGGTTVEAVIPIKITERAATEDTMTLLFYLTFADGRSSEVTNETYISIPMIKEYSVKIAALELEDYCYVNENTIVSSEIVNESADTVKDAELHILQENESETVYLVGDVSGGLTKYFDYTIRMEQSGEQMLRAYLSYKDEEGNAYVTEQTEYSVRVLEESPEKQNLQNTDKKDINKSFLVTNAVLVVIAFLIIIVFHKRGSRRINSGKEVGDGKRS